MARRTHPSHPRIRPVTLAAALALASGAAHAQTWTRVATNPPAAVSLLLLLSDGSVMAAGNNGSTIGRTWYKLTPNAAGSYVNGTWSTLASAIDTRLYYSSQVCKDGRVFVAGGEYGTGTAHAEIYDPIANTWTQINPPASVLDPTQVSGSSGTTQRFYDSNSGILENGSILIAPVFPKTPGVPVLYNPATNTWASASHYFRGTYQDETAWAKLPDGTILTMDPFGSITYGAGNNPTERYDPVSATWINDGNVPVTMFDAFGFELGGAVVLPNGNAFFLGSSGQTAIYTPTGSSAPGSWAAGPVIPGSHGTPDAPAAMMVNGKVICAVSPLPTSGNHFPTPTTFYEYDYLANSFAPVPTPTGGTEAYAPYQTCFLCLPDGSVMYSRMNVAVYIYNSPGAPLAIGKPVIQSISANVDGSFHLTGTGLNGISEGATYGDDLQMSSNYPIVRIHHSNGNKYYARSFNWSSTSVMTGSRVLSTEYKLPASLPAGPYSVVVIGNGFASDPVSSPAISSQPSPQAGCGSAPAVFSVGATGVGPLTYQWRRGATPLANGGNIAGADTDTLTISPVGSGDLGSDYNCVITNVLGSVTTDMASLTFCYANCDCSTTSPALNVQDFSCFLNAFASGDTYANCDGSTLTPSLNVQDFSCFLNQFAAGCT
jgi:hypothetical protein